MKMDILSKFHGQTLIFEATRAPLHVTPGSTLRKPITIATFHIFMVSFAHVFKTFV